jgi:hypothetical protein
MRAKPANVSKWRKYEIQEARSLGSDGTFSGACVYDEAPCTLIGPGQAIVSWQGRLFNAPELALPTRGRHYRPSNTSISPK